MERRRPPPADARIGGGRRTTHPRISSRCLQSDDERYDQAGGRSGGLGADQSDDQALCATGSPPDLTNDEVTCRQ